MSDLSRLYEQDFPAWSAQTIALLSQARFGELDLDHLVEELGNMGKRERGELVNRLRVLLADLLKWQFQYRRLSARWAEIEGKTWRNSILEQRAALRYLLEQNHWLQGVLDDAIAESYPQAVELAADQTELTPGVFPRDCPFSQAQILERDYYLPWA